MGILCNTFYDILYYDKLFLLTFNTQGGDNVAFEVLIQILASVLASIIIL